MLYVFDVIKVDILLNKLLKFNLVLFLINYRNTFCFGDKRINRKYNLFRLL
jgi:hypothetical protein